MENKNASSEDFNVYECYRCGAEVTLDDKVCPACGADLSETYSCSDCGATVSADDKICPHCGADLTEVIDDSAKSIKPHSDFNQMNNDDKISYLLQRLNDLENKIPKTKIISPNFWTRAWAVYGHNLATGLIVGAVVYFVITFFTLLTALCR